jgi:hypothetical protein
MYYSTYRYSLRYGFDTCEVDRESMNPSSLKRDGKKSVKKELREPDERPQV